MRWTFFFAAGFFFALLALAGCSSELGSPDPTAPQSDMDALRAAEMRKVAAAQERGESDTLSLLGAGGPDEFGYTWADSDDPDGPTYDWVEISGTATPVPFPGSYADDANVGPVPIGFEVPFYGNSFDQLYVCSNGWLSFTNNSLTTFANRILPNHRGVVPENLLAPWWDDMVYDESVGNQAYYFNDGSRFVIEFDLRRVTGYNPPISTRVAVEKSALPAEPQSYHYQVILYPDGTIVYQYRSLGNVLDSATIGIQNATKEAGLTVVHNNGTYTHPELAIEFRPGTPAMVIDIKPGNPGNPINLRSRGEIPVAILSTPAFDALEVDVATIAFGPAGAGVLPAKVYTRDVDGDGDLDLLMHFLTQETGIQPTDTEACLWAQLLDGTAVEACDNISVVPGGERDRLQEN